MQVLVVVDMQNDFIDGALGTQEAVLIVPKVAEKIKNFSGKIIATRDTHGADYLDTQEGKILPVAHCIRESSGWEIQAEIKELISEPPVDKETFGSVELWRQLKALDEKEKIEKITLVGLCTDICVISNALLAKAFLPETPVAVDAACCAGVTPESHNRALLAMQTCQVMIENGSDLL